MQWTDHLISINQFSVSELEQFFEECENTKNRGVEGSGRTIANLFYEPSTRTSASFMAAAFRLNINVIPINNVEYSSVSKGENLADTIKTLCYYCDLIVLRHPENDAADRAIEHSSVPIVNAGCGTGEHPTQALIDAFTICEHFDYFKGLKVLFIGDNDRSRTVHSLAKLLWTLGTTDISYLDPRHEHYNMDNFIEEAWDVVYVTRIQTERGSTGEYLIPINYLQNLPKTSIVMHPFPRVSEIPQGFDIDPRAKYFRQIENGVTVRQQILVDMLNL